jgi:hypothetical protein
VGVVRAAPTAAGRGAPRRPAVVRRARVRRAFALRALDRFSDRRRQRFERLRRHREVPTEEAGSKVHSAGHLGHRGRFLLAHEPGEDVWGQYDRRTRHGSADDRLLRPRRQHHRPVMGVTRCVEGNPPRLHNFRGSRGRRHGPPGATGRGVRKWRRRQTGGDASAENALPPRGELTRGHRWLFLIAHEPGEDVWGKFDRRTCHGSADDRLLRPRRHHHRPVMGVTRCVEGDPPRRHNIRGSRGRRHGPPDATGRGIRKWRRRRNGAPGGAGGSRERIPRSRGPRDHRRAEVGEGRAVQIRSTGGQV